MKRNGVLVIATLAIAAVVELSGWGLSGWAAEPPGELASVRILFGLMDTAPTRWDGTVEIARGTVKAIQGVHFGPEDSTDYQSKWTAATRAQGKQVVENGVIITATVSPDSRWTIQTARGRFSFTLRDIRWGDSRTFLDGAISVEQVPPTTQLTMSSDDEYAPAIAAAPDGAWLVFTRFSHADRSREGILNTGKPLDNFDELVRPAGGDQIFLMHWDKARDAWSRPVPVSPKGEATAGVAIAVDGQNRVWMIWSALREGGFHLFARRRAATGGWDPEIRITDAAGPDIKPVAATDASGRIWVAWQGYRNGNFEILASVQDGDKLSAEKIVSFSRANDWDPAIAAAPNGEVAIAWDTYDKGDYDVYARRLRAGGTAGPAITMDAPTAVATTPYFEARSSVAFDAKGRLWIAYEIGSARWGGNFGLYDTSGSPLYEDRDIAIRCLDNGVLETTADDLINVMPGPPGPAHRRSPRPNRNLLDPNPARAENRKPGQAIGPRNGSVNSSPRLAVDTAGGVYLAFRTLSNPAMSRSPVGPIWVENITYFNGHNWSGAIFVPRSDGPLEATPALLTPEPGRLIAVTPMDHRQSIPTGLGADRINGDLYLADFRPGIAETSSPDLAAAGPGAPPAQPAASADTDAVRNYRIEIAGRAPLRILRGDFNRYSDYAPDGARDGSLDDAYRYMIDAAALDWGACCDADTSGVHEYFWWLEQNAADAYHLPDRFTPLFGYDRPVRYPEGRRAILFPRRGIRPLPHLPPAAADSPAAQSADTQMLYRYVRSLAGVSIPESPTTDSGTDWRDNDPIAEPLAAIYEGQRQNYEAPAAPRSPSPDDAISGFHASGFISRALAQGHRLGFAAASGHYSAHIAFTNVLAAANTPEAILDAMRQRHVYASTANMVADVRSGDHIMGDEFEGPAVITIHLLGQAPFTKVAIIKNGTEAWKAEPRSREVKLEWSGPAPQPGKAASYYVRAEQSDGNLVWTSPMWITAKQASAAH